MKKEYLILEGLAWIEDTSIWIEKIGNQVNYANQNFSNLTYIAVTTHTHPVYKIFIRRHSILKIYMKRCTVKRIQLRLTVSGGTIGFHEVEFHRCFNDVDISTVTWNTRPTDIEKFTSIAFGIPGTDYIFVDITDKIKEVWNEGKQELILYLKSYYENWGDLSVRDVTFGSTENPNEDFKPKLIVDF